MQYALLLAAAGFAAAQGVTQAIPPPGGAPAGCSPDYSGSFEVTVVTPPSKRDLEKRQAPPLEVTLQGGILKDSEGRTGYIAANNQFQFDGPPQTGAIYTAGWSACANGTLALGPQITFLQCLSGGFYNIYDKNTAQQCIPVQIQIIPGSTTGGSGAETGATSAASAPAPAATEAADGQPQASSAVPAITQIGDGQVQATAAVAPITQIADGQIQATAPATQAPITQISDGQVQASAPAAPAPASSPAPTPAAPAPAPVTQISDGQVQATAPAAPLYTGAANKLAGQVGGAVLLAAAALAL